MELGELVLYVAIGAAVLTGIFGFAMRRVENYALSALQNFAGLFFIVSGLVKVVDPLGTAYKMQDYFEQFEITFESTWLHFISGLFPVLSDYAIIFSVFVILLELLIGVMLVIGHRRQLIAWIFFLLVLFFTALTGFTFLTGFVPTDSTFFEFSSWQSYDPNNMRVTDCGCFGDFIKLEPRVSFLKDVFLLIPAIVFIFFWRKKHQLFHHGTREIITGLSFLVFLVYALSNYLWNIPDFDFRPFKEGVNIYERKNAEEESAANVSIEKVLLTEKETGKVVELSYEEYMKVFKEYPSEKYEVNYTYSEPELEPTKISEFTVYNDEGENMAEELLTVEGYSFWVIAPKINGEVEYQTEEVQDSIFVMDTLSKGEDSLRLTERLDTVITSTREIASGEWDANYVSSYEDAVLPLINRAEEDQIPAYLIAGKMSWPGIRKFADDIGWPGQVLEADDILLKTIIRSNPGIVLMQDGKVVKKWHWKQVPGYEEIRDGYLK